MSFNLTSEHISMASTAALFGPAAAALNSINGTSKFEDTPPAKPIGITILLIILMIVLIFFIMLLRAVYNLTGSGMQTLLCFLFTTLYLVFATMYYGLSGYKYKLANGNLNSRN